MESTTGEPVTLSFAAFDMEDCEDWVEINDGTSTQRYCGFCSNCNYFGFGCNYCGSTPGPVTGTTITVNLHTSQVNTGTRIVSGFFAAVTGDVTVTSSETSESEVGKCVIEK